MASNSTIAVLQPVVERYITASDGTRIFATAVGQSHLPSLVFVHGYAFSALIWASIMANSDLLKKFYLVAYDLRGHGRSGKPTTPAGYLSHLFAEDFANVVREFGLDSPVYIGWSYGGTVAADIFSYLDPGAISGIIYTAAVPWNGQAFQEVAHPYLVNEIQPGLVSFDNVTAAFDSRIKIAESISNKPEKVPTERKWSWIGSAALVGPLSTQLLLTRQQDPEPLLKAGAAGFPTLLITGGKDTFIQSDLLKALLERNFTNMATYDFPKGGHSMFYDFEEEYVREIARFAASVFGNKTVAQE
ncbi:Alpha/Beta hydrolase protein [Coprinopsis sp. MPI-PUGE-AT-0042]|nr:Alpha/Beta hydrolase protein [Coprinopsis sp. MPI-PUGE-AT-0042]